MTFKYDKENKKTLCSSVQWKNVDMLANEELEDWLYGDDSIYDNSWVEELNKKDP